MSKVIGGCKKCGHEVISTDDGLVCKSCGKLQFPAFEVTLSNSTYDEKTEIDG